MTTDSEATARTGETATFKDYLKLARFDHVTKHIFIVPGVVLAALLRPEVAAINPVTIALGFLSAICLASANYVINEWLDRDFDRYHPEKSKRAAVQLEMSVSIVLIEYAILLVLGLALALMVGFVFGIVATLFALSGVAYNVKPLRTKDKVFIDVLTESLNNPLRLTLGWLMVDGWSLPPGSTLLAFWFGGAFLMNAKRLAEFRDIVREHGQEQLGLYRRSFRFYTERRLLVATLLYALLSAFFTAIFFVKYRIEYIIIFPALTFMFCEYFILALKPHSVARRPEHLFKAKRLMGFVVALGVLFVFATYVDLPFLDKLTTNHFIELRPLQ